MTDRLAPSVAVGLEDAMRLPPELYSSALTSRFGPGVNGAILSATLPLPVVNDKTSTSLVVSITPESLTVVPETPSDVIFFKYFSSRNVKFFNNSQL